MFFKTVHDWIGHTPLVQLKVDAPSGTTVYAKLEMHNPFGMKDRVAKSIIEQARRIGELQPGAPIVESSSGTLALGVALVGRSLGHEVHIVTDPRIDAITLAKLRAMGTDVHIVSAMDDNGWQGARLRRLAELRADIPGAFWPRQYTNPDNPRAYRALAKEIHDDVGAVDFLVGAVGSGGSLCGSTRALRRYYPELRTVGVDCVGSALFGQDDVPGRLQSGLGNSLSPHNLDRTLIEEVHWLNDYEAFAATRDLAAEQQIFAGNTSGSVYRVLTDVARRAEPGSRIVGILPDRGDRYTDTVYSDEYWEAHNITALGKSTEPALVSYGTQVRNWSRASVTLPADRTRWLIFVESNTSGTGMTALRATRDMGLTPVLLTSKPDRYASLADTGAEVIECDANSLPELRSVIQQRFSRQDIAGVTTTSDFYVPMVAELVDWLGLWGNPVSAPASCRNKAVLRQRLMAEAVNQPTFAVVTENHEVEKAIEHVGLPCVVKPADSSGSKDVRLCSTSAEVAAQVQHVLAIDTNERGLTTAGTAVVEEYVDGPEYSVEVFSQNGQHTCIGITEKSTTNGPFFVETGHLFPAPLSNKDAEAITSTVNKTLDAVGWLQGPTHTEVKLTDHGASVIEVNPRLAGGMIPEIIREATGTDLLEQQLRSAAGLDVDLRPRDNRYAGIAFLTTSESGIIQQVDGVEDAQAIPDITSVHVTAKPGATAHRTENAYGRLGHVIASGSSTTAVRTALGKALETIQIRLDHQQTTGEDRP